MYTPSWYWSPVSIEQFEDVRANFNVEEDKCDSCSQWKGRGEESDVLGVCVCVWRASVCVHVRVRACVYRHLIIML